VSKGSSSNASPPRVSLSHSPSHNRWSAALVPYGFPLARTRTLGVKGTAVPPKAEPIKDPQTPGVMAKPRASVAAGMDRGAVPCFEHPRVTACDASVTDTKRPALRCLVEASPSTSSRTTPRPLDGPRKETESDPRRWDRTKEKGIKVRGWLLWVVLEN